MALATRWHKGRPRRRAKPSFRARHLSDQIRDCECSPVLQFYECCSNRLLQARRAFARGGGEEAASATGDGWSPRGDRQLAQASTCGSGRRHRRWHCRAVLSTTRQWLSQPRAFDADGAAMLPLAAARHVRLLSVTLQGSGGCLGKVVQAEIPGLHVDGGISRLGPT